MIWHGIPLITAPRWSEESVRATAKIRRGLTISSTLVDTILSRL